MPWLYEDIDDKVNTEHDRTKNFYESKVEQESWERLLNKSLYNGQLVLESDR